MSRIAIVGCGFVGGIMAIEAAKREFAFKKGTEFVLIDFDKYEERNCANQVCTTKDVDKLKSHVVADIIAAYGHKTSPQSVKIEAKNIEAVLGECNLIVDAVDNLPTRQLLWEYGVKTNKPVLHVGVSMQGTGRVEWNDGKHDSFSLSPLALLSYSEKQIKAMTEVKSSELPPCELVGFRGLGLNIGLAAAKALYIFLGFDPEKHTDKCGGVYTDWSATNEGHKLESVA